jgi:hypothetical protein
MEVNKLLAIEATSRFCGFYLQFTQEIPSLQPSVHTAKKEEENEL